MLARNISPVAARRERRRRPAVTAQSPDKSITVRFERSAGFFVTIEPGSIRGRSESRIAGEVNAALATVLADAERVFASTGDGTDSPRRRRPADIEVTYTTVMRWVTATWCGERDLRVRVRPRIPGSVDEAALAAELTVALCRVRNEHAKAVGRIRRTPSADN